MAQLMVAFYNDFYTSKLVSWVFDQLISVADDPSLADADVPVSLRPLAPDQYRDSDAQLQSRALRFATKILLFTLGDRCAPADVDDVHRRLLAAWGPARSVYKIVIAGQTMTATNPLPPEVVATFTRRQQVVAGDSHLEEAYVVSWWLTYIVSHCCVGRNVFLLPLSIRVTTTSSRTHSPQPATE